MKKAFFLLGFGLLPLLVAIVLVYLGSLQDSAALEYWTVAPWFIIVAIPICGVTFFIAFVTLVIYGRVSGSTSRKKKFAAASFVVMTLAAGGIAAALWTDRQRENQELIADQKLVLQFVKNHPLVIQTAGKKFDVYPSSWIDADNLPTRYDLFVSTGNTTRHAFVDVSRTSGTPVFSLVCISPPSDKFRYSLHDNDPCAQK